MSYIVSAFFLLMKEKSLKSNIRKSYGTGSKQTEALTKIAVLQQRRQHQRINVLYSSDRIARKKQRAVFAVL
jgi:hypothetical protein